MALLFQAPFTPHESPEPVTMQAPAPLPAREKDCGCSKRTPRFPKPLPRPEDTPR